MNTQQEKFIRKTVAVLMNTAREVTVGVSNRHIHLSERDFAKLFGGSGLTVKKELMQPGQYAAEETVTLIGPKGKLSRVRVLGPFRSQTQVELSKTDCAALGVKAPMRKSGELKDTPGIIVEGPLGTLNLTFGVIVAHRHIHMDPWRAALLGLKNQQRVDVETAGDRGTILKNVMIQVSERFATEMHIDTDEANACDLRSGDIIRIL